MLNKLQDTLIRYSMLEPGDTVVCAVSGGADSMALLWAMYLLREKLQIRLSAVHFNHHLRGAESDEDAAFVQNFCDGFHIPCYMGQAYVAPGAKGLEAAAREARYAFFQTLPGKIATAHTANDNAETLLLHLVRGTGLKGLGGIAPVRGNLIRPMLDITRQEILSFLAAYHIPYREDSSNLTDAFLRNRIRHRVFPLLEQENPRLAENLSATAQRLRLDDQALEGAVPDTNSVTQLRQLSPALRGRALNRFLLRAGVKEPEAQHIALLEQLVFSKKPSAGADLPGGVRIARQYDTLQVLASPVPFSPTVLHCPGSTELPQLGLRITCDVCQVPVRSGTCFSVGSDGALYVRPRASGDRIRLAGGSKSLKALFIDLKIPAQSRDAVPVVCDERGILGVYGIGPDLDRAENPNITITFESISIP